MSPSSRAVSRLRALYRNVLLRMRNASARIRQPLCHGPAVDVHRLESLEPRLMLSGTTYVVDSALDVVASDGLVTLREAIDAANSNTAVHDAQAGSSTEMDHITFDASLDGIPVVLGGTELLISDELEIVGLGKDQTIIDAAGLSRVVSTGETTSQLSGLTLTGGASDNGGAILNRGDMTLVDCNIGNSTAMGWGGGILHFRSTMTLFRCNIYGNVSGEDGGGIYSGFDTLLTLTECSVTSNVVTGDSEHGGGIFGRQTVVMQDSIISGNQVAGAGSDGAGVCAAVLKMSGCTVLGNSGAQEGGGLLGSTMELIQCKILGNSSYAGGGISVYTYGTATLTDCLVVGNTALVVGGGICNSSGSTLEVTSSTVCANVSDRDAGGIESSYGALLLSNTIVALNSNADGVADVRGSSSGSNNIVGSYPVFIRDPDNGGDGWGDILSTTEVDESANDDYGDLRLRPGSPAIDAGDNALLPSDGFDLDNDGDTTEHIPYDLYGNPRVIGAAVDIGAYESDQAGDVSYSYVSVDVDGELYTIHAVLNGGSLPTDRALAESLDGQYIQDLYVVDGSGNPLSQDEAMRVIVLAQTAMKYEDLSAPASIWGADFEEVTRRDNEGIDYTTYAPYGAPVWWRNLFIYTNWFAYSGALDDASTRADRYAEVILDAALQPERADGVVNQDAARDGLANITRILDSSFRESVDLPPLIDAGLHTEFLVITRDADEPVSLDLLVESAEILTEAMKSPAVQKALHISPKVSGYIGKLNTALGPLGDLVGLGKQVTGAVGHQQFLQAMAGAAAEERLDAIVNYVESTPGVDPALVAGCRQAVGEFRKYQQEYYDSLPGILRAAMQDETLVNMAKFAGSVMTSLGHKAVGKALLPWMLSWEVHKAIRAQVHSGAQAALAATLATGIKADGLDRLKALVVQGGDVDGELAVEAHRLLEAYYYLGYYSYDRSLDILANEATGFAGWLIPGNDYELYMDELANSADQAMARCGLLATSAMLASQENPLDLQATDDEYGWLQGLVRDYVPEDGTAMPLEAHATADVTSGTGSVTVQFTDESVGATSKSWDFGDGTRSTQANPSHTFDAAGVYVVTLTVSDGSEQDTSLPMTITVEEEAPSASFMASNIGGAGPLEVTFSDTSDGGAITSWTWSFGDGATSSEQNPVHVYELPGTYSVELVVAGPGGTSTMRERDLVVVSGQTASVQLQTGQADATYVVDGPVTRTLSGSDVTLEDLPEGTYEVQFVPVDGYAAPAPTIIEIQSGTSQTVSASYTAAPDMVIETASVTWSGISGEVTYELSNWGSATADSGVDVILSTDKILGNGDDVLLDRSYHVNLTSGSTSVTTTSLELPLDVAAGTYYVAVVADNEGLVAEPFEDDNYWWSADHVVEVSQTFDYHFEIARNRYGDNSLASHGKAILAVWPELGRAVQSVSLTLPDGTSFEWDDLGLAADQPAEFTEEDMLGEGTYTPEELLNVFTEGLYRVVLTHADLAVRSVNFTRQTSAFPDWPVISYPQDGDVLYSLPFELTWQAGENDWYQIIDDQNNTIQYGMFSSEAPDDGTHTIDATNMPGPGDYLLRIDRNDWGTTYLGSMTSVRASYVDSLVLVDGHPFHNNTSLDGNDPAADSSDDHAIAVGKQALRSGQAASNVNITASTKGTNGVMIDIANPAVTPSISDFALTVGTVQDSSTWQAAPVPTDFSVRPGEGEGGSDRVTIIWADGAIINEWLRVTVLSDTNGGTLGLAEDDVFAFGNLVGDLDGSGTVSFLDAARTAARIGKTSATPADGDVDGSGMIDVADADTVVGNLGSQLLMTPELRTAVSLEIAGPAEVTESTSAQYTLTAEFADGSTSDVTSAAAWSEASSYIDSLSGGLLEAGSVTSDQADQTISASYGGLTASSDITILSDAADDVYEENDTLATAADPFSSGGNWEQTWLSSISGEGIQADEDWYKIYISPGYENLKVELQFTHAQGDIDLGVYDINGSMVAWGMSVTDNESIDTVLPSSGTYYLRVFSYDDLGNTYDLWWDDLAVA